MRAGVESIEPLEARLAAAGVPFTRSMSGRPALFFRDPDANCLEVVEAAPWRAPAGPAAAAAQQ